MKHVPIRAWLLLIGVTGGIGALAWRAGLAPPWAALIGLNIATVACYGFDKHRARVAGRRVPESFLHVLALLGGSPGAFAGQQLFRHKTRDRRFRLVFWGTVVLQAGLVGIAWWHSRA